MPAMFTVAFARVCDFCVARGHQEILKHPGLLELQVDEHWWIAVNPHKDTMKCSKGADVPFAHVYIEFNGWPAGLLSPNSGTLAAGEAANEDTFIAALEAATVALGGSLTGEEKDERRGHVDDDSDDDFGVVYVPEGD